MRSKQFSRRKGTWRISHSSMNPMNSCDWSWTCLSRPSDFLSSLNFERVLTSQFLPPINRLKLSTEVRGFGEQSVAQQPGVSPLGSRKQMLHPHPRTRIPGTRIPRPGPSARKALHRCSPSSHLCPEVCCFGADPRWRGASARSVW